MSAQTFRLKIIGSSDAESKVIDSIGYSQIIPNAKAASEEATILSGKLQKIGYLSNQVTESTKPSDSLFHHKLSLGKKINLTHIYIGKDSALKTLQITQQKSDTLTMPFAETEIFLNRMLNSLESKGYSLARLKLINLNIVGSNMYADLNLDLGVKRQLNEIVISGYDKFPKGHKRNIERMYRNKTFNQENLKKIHDDFQKFRFVGQTKYPEILFSKDTTKVYVYLEKAKPNRFDGFIGFSNDADENNLTFQGYLDLMLVNIMNSGEQFTLYWKSDGKEQKTFNAGIELPYIFKSPIGLKASLNIFKQDSTFQNTRSSLDLGYFFNYNTRLYVGYQSTESSDIQNQNNFSISDFNNTFITSNFEYVNYRADDFLFPEQTRASIRLGVGSRESNQSKNDQIFSELHLSHNVYLNQKNIFNIKSQNYYLNSGQYILNELYRFGGINSIRGFNENSLQANFFSSVLTEYRYVVAPNIYVHSIIDYGYYRDDTTDNGGGLLGLGFGFGLLTKNGLLNLVYANGSTDEQSIKLSNSIVHISFRATF
ncbi:MAG TPA: hypothetical protein VF581_01365 [Flavobacterium sp.]|jgi:hypothetical protein